MVISALDRKLLRDLSHLRGQVITIALVVACGIASYATMRGAWLSLHSSRATYYERYRFADVFASLERAPESLGARLDALPGVSLAYTRVRKGVKLPMEGMLEPATGIVMSLPDTGPPPLNNLYLLAGRLPDSEHADEVVVLETFVEAHALSLDDHIPVVIGGVLRSLRIVGVAMSPEFVMPLPAGEMIPDKKRFTILWVARSSVGAAFDMDGAFNDVVLKLQPGASERAAIDGVNNLLEPYGGLGAYGRDKQLSNRLLESELEGLEVMATVIPAIFLGVAAFLVNVVLSRLILLQRTQIAALKAVGYGNRQVGVHYLKLVSLIVLLGSVLGVGTGVYLGQGLMNLYSPWYRFPSLTYTLEPRIVFVGIGVSLVSAVVGAILTVATVVRLAPAEAMRPQSPILYRRSMAERLHLDRVFGQSIQMVVREIARRPMRTLLSAFGIAMAVAILVSGRFSYDAVDRLMDIMFNVAQREDLVVTFMKPVPDRARRELLHLPGVHHGEGLRVAAVRFRAGHVTREASIMGYPRGSVLRRIVDIDGHVHRPPPEGLMLSRTLADILRVQPGETIRVELLEGQRGFYDVPITSTVDDIAGLQGYMELTSLNRLLGEDRVISMAALTADETQFTALYKQLSDRPTVLGVTRLDAMLDMFEEQTAAQMQTFTFILTLFASIIAAGVVYNNARVSLSMRSRDLASLRVLGFRRREISAVLLGELAIQVVLAIPIGMVIGKSMAEGMMATVDPEMYRFPVTISTRTYAFAAMVTVAAALLSALLVRRKLDKLDLIGVLKTRE